MNREQAREIAAKAWHTWAITCVPVGLSEFIADALHAAYEAERAKPTQPRIVQHECPGEYPEDECPQDSLHNELAVRAEKIRELESRIASIRLSSIKETARRILSAEATTGEDSLNRRRREFNGAQDEPGGMETICNYTLDWAESFESAFERRYGGKP